MKTVGVRILIIYFSLFNNLQAQVQVTGAFQSDSILIGDEIDFSLSIRCIKEFGVEKIFRNSFDSIISVLQTQIQNSDDSLGEEELVVADYEIISWGHWKNVGSKNFIEPPGLSFDTTLLGNQVLLENTIKFRFWEPGPQILKIPWISGRLSGEQISIPSEEMSTVYVKAPFQKQLMSGDSIDLAPIKPIFKEPKNISDYLVHLIMLGSLIIAFCLWYFRKMFIKQKIMREREIKIQIPAHTIALDKLHQLKEQKLWQKGEIKKFQSELTHIIREYLENRYGIFALESTTDEIMRDLHKRNFDKKLENSLREILQVADLVKFAKAKPELSIHEQFLNRAFEFVRNTSIKEPEKTVS